MCAVLQHPLRGGSDRTFLGMKRESLLALFLHARSASLAKRLLLRLLSLLLTLVVEVRAYRRHAANGNANGIRLAAKLVQPTQSSQAASDMIASCVRL